MQFLNNFAVYDWITIIYITVGIACFIWTSIGNDYVFNKIEKIYGFLLNISLWVWRICRWLLRYI